MYSVIMISIEHNIDYAARQVPAKERSVEAPGAVSPAQELGSQVVPWAVEQHPYTGPGTAEASSTRQSCIKKLERPPHDVKSEMLEPTRTEIKTTGTYAGIVGCDSLQRIAMHRAQIKQKGHWLGIEGDGWYAVTGKNDTQSFNILDLATHGVKEKKVRGRWEPAREQFRVIVRDPRNGKVISTGKIKNYKVKIDG